ncbi:MAG TPA: zf-HC2 domain-containing protein [Polyangia bacterium]|nr:zf-HC2 domain-containing protein [Polyangia bacterium]
MTCSFERLLSGYIDGELPLRELARVRDHLDSCAGCARAEAELRRLVAAVRALPPDREPPAEQWSRIAAELDAKPSPRRPWRRRISLGVGLVAAAAAAGVVIARPAPSGQSEQALREDARKQLAAAEADYAQLARTLRAIAEHDRKGWRPEVAQAFDDNLRTIDDAIERFRAAAHRSGADPAAMEHLFAAYRRQLEFLREAISQGAAGASELDPL